jgi:Holliday junction resolvase RusA-like endonuclease
VLHLTVPVAPVPKPRQSPADRWRPSPRVLRYRAFADAVRAFVGPPPCLVASVELVFFLPAPKARRRGAKALREGSPHTLRPDTDNLVKAVLDALWEHDSGVWRITAEKRWTLGEARFELRITPTESPGFPVSGDNLENAGTTPDH